MMECPFICISKCHNNFHLKDLMDDSLWQWCHFRWCHQLVTVFVEFNLMCCTCIVFILHEQKKGFKKSDKKKRIGQKTQESLSVSWSSYNTFKKNTQKDDFSRYGWATSNFHKVKQIVPVFAYRNQYFFVYCKAINHVVRKNVAFSFFCTLCPVFLNK